MLDEPFRAWLARAASAPARGMQAAGISPNAVTVAAFALSVSAVIPIANGRLGIGLALWLAGRLLDGYDGLLARMSGRTSLFGGFLDISLDMLAYSAMAIAFAWRMPADRTLWMLVLLGYIGVITTTLALSSLLERAARQVGGDRSLQFTPGLAEGGETTLVYCFVALAPNWSRWVLSVWVVVLAITVVTRMRAARRLLQQGEGNSRTGQGLTGQ
jgi:phosphatidylglycerophosphate synthase